MADRLRSLAELYPDEAGFMDSPFVPPKAKIARLRAMLKEQEPKPPRKPRNYKGSKAAKRASRGKP